MAALIDGWRIALPAEDLGLSECLLLRGLEGLGDAGCRLHVGMRKSSAEMTVGATEWRWLCVWLLHLVVLNLFRMLEVLVVRALYGLLLIAR